MTDAALSHLIESLIRDVPDFPKAGVTFKDITPQAPTHALNTLASSTPTSDGERLYCVWWDGAAMSVHGYDLAGKELWSGRLRRLVPGRSAHIPGEWAKRVDPGAGPLSLRLG